MEVGIIGLVIAVVSGLGSFALGRWLTNRRRQKKAQQARAAEQAAQSRQVRRARERRQRR
jgi:type II secretory pathway pseudopilin PulG